MEWWRPIAVWPAEGRDISSCTTVPSATGISWNSWGLENFDLVRWGLLHYGVMNTVPMTWDLFPKGPKMLQMPGKQFTTFLWPFTLKLQNLFLMAWIVTSGLVKANIVLIPRIWIEVVWNICLLHLSWTTSVSVSHNILQSKLPGNCSPV